ncbi:ORC1-type DNA replication protein [Methanogenium organophilum]|uniref:ORC1-type DNA replication protein n=1 Tax=Methanogenium organophilum TaxID=2199 RepID=A0A9X9T7Z4_METOG|nr:ORC1-type DNA replication protein [Methanogenium organophilum]WAI00612.1 ORC1-type DNA replication protein [Methanogenium organophilum]
MKKNLLMWDESLFQDMEVFEFDFLPGQFDFRETQEQELAFQIQPALRGGRPLNTICRGLPGTGKTTSVRKLFSEIEEHTKKIVPVHINCQIDNTKFAIFSQIFRRISGHKTPASGTSFKQVFDAVCNYLITENVVLLVCLDDANYLMYENEINKVLYTLLRAHESYPGAKIGVITVISDMSVDLMKTVDARVASVFQPTDIYFPPYDEDEIKEILRQRIKQGFYPGVISEGMLTLITEQTMKGGDLRVGIDLLKRAGLNAEKDARRSVERDDVCRAYEVSKYLHLTATIRALQSEERALLRLIAVRSRDEKDMAAGKVHEAVKESSMKLGYTRFYEMVKKFDSMRLINLHYREGRGRTRLITIRYDPDRVIEAIDSC